MIKFLPSTQFRAELEAEVDAYFERTKLPRRDVPSMYLKTVVVMTWLATSWMALVFFAQHWWQALPAALSLGLAMAAVGFNVQHDGNHGGYSERPWINHMMALALDLLGGSAYFWHYKHNIAHHTYSNIPGHDDDFNAGPLGRLCPQQPRFRLHRWQHYYIWGVYALLAVEWQTTGEFRNFLSKRRIASTAVPAPRGWDLVVFWIGRVVFFSLAFAIPLTRHALWQVLVMYLIVAMTLGLVLSIVFQLAHCNGEAAFREPIDGKRMEQEWAAHQVETTVDFCHSNRALSWFLGGLNFQIEHHLFPKICHVHYPALAPIVERVAQKHGLRYFAYPSVWSAVRSHYQWLRWLGEPTPSPLTVAVP